MRVLILLFSVFAAGAVAAVNLPGMTDLLLLVGPAALASLILIIWTIARGTRRREVRPTNPHDPAGKFRPAAKKVRHILVDGSNVIHWKDGTPQLDTLREVLARLTALGYQPGVVFDANAGYKIGERYRDDGDLGRMLGLHKDRVLVVPRGTQADPALLATARDLGARIVTNDRYRDWVEAFPEVAGPGLLVRGGFKDGVLWLDMD